MEGTERPYITEGAHVTNNTLKADTLMPFFFFFFLALVLTKAIVSRSLPTLILTK